MRCVACEQIGISRPCSQDWLSLRSFFFLLPERLDSCMAHSMWNIGLDSLGFKHDGRWISSVRPIFKNTTISPTKPLFM